MREDQLREPGGEEVNWANAFPKIRDRESVSGSTGRLGANGSGMAACAAEESTLAIATPWEQASAGLCLLDSPGW